MVIIIFIIIGGVNEKGITKYLLLREVLRNRVIVERVDYVVNKFFICFDCAMHIIVRK